MKITALLFASAIMVAGAPLSMAAEPDAPWLADFRKSDLNDSGGLSKVELDKTRSVQLQPIKNNFKAIDQDGDGHVTQAEYERFQSQADDKLAARFRQADLNDSGGLSRKELEKVSTKPFDMIRKNFDAIDADKDGQVTLTEYQHYQGGSARSGATVAKARTDHCQPNCGVVIEVDRYKVEGEGSLLGTIAGGLAGGVLGNQVGSGTGKTVATVGGAAGGAYVGHQVEKKLKTKKMVKVTVKLDNGQQQDFDFEAESSPFVRGDRVQVRDGELTRYSGQ